MIIPKKINVKIFSRETKVDNFTCYDCKVIKRALRGNDKKLLSKIKLYHKCLCSKHIVISLAKKQHPDGLIGKITIQQIRHNKYETHSHIYKEEFRGKGLGLYLYSLAADYCLRHNLQLHSSVIPSLQAQRVWKSKKFKEKYKITKVKNRWKIEGRHA